MNWKTYDYKDYIDVENNSIKGLPKLVTISTMCGSCVINSTLNRDNIWKYLPLNSDDILAVMENKKSYRSLIKIDEKDGKKFYNQITVLVRINEGPCEDLNKEKKLNIKLFDNGSVQLSGVKDVADTNKAFNKLLYRLAEEKGILQNNKIRDLKFAENNKNLQISNFKIYMINCNYHICIKIKREKLHEILSVKRKDTCLFESSIGAYVSIKYKPKNCDRVVTISLFEKGNISITGAKNISNVCEAHDFINGIIVDHVNDVFKSYRDENDDDLLFQLYDEVTEKYKHQLELSS